MSCQSCGTPYKLFKKERGCKNCGYSFCSSCLNKKAVVPKLGDNAKHSVCAKCYAQLTGSSVKPSSSAEQSPPKALLRRMDDLEHKKSNIATAASTRQPANKPNMREIDQRLQDRLEKLKAAKQPVNVPTVENMEERLARLKGMDPAMYAKSPVVYYSSKSSGASSTEQVNDLLRQAREEVFLNSRHQSMQSSQAESATNDLNKFENEEAFSQTTQGAQLSITDAKGIEACANNVDVNKMFFEAAKDCKMDIRAFEKDSGRLANLNEVNKLFEEVAKEGSEEAQKNLNEMQKDKELEKKLLQLKKNQDWSDRRKSERTEPDDDVSDEDNEKQLIDKVLNQLLEESALDDKVERGNSLKVKKKENKDVEVVGPKVRNTGAREVHSSDEDADDELPYCCICVENAKLRCIDCERDLYCMNCFRKCHDELEISHHETVPFKFPTNWRD